MYSFEILIGCIGITAIFFSILSYKLGVGAAQAKEAAKPKLTNIEILDRMQGDILRKLMESGIQQTTIKPQEMFDRGQQTIDAFNDVKKCLKYVEDNPA